MGRTHSVWTPPAAIQNNQETITYTVYNEQANPETGVLLTDTLSPGETITSDQTAARPERTEPGLEPGDDPEL